MTGGVPGVIPNNRQRRAKSVFQGLLYKAGMALVTLSGNSRRQEFAELGDYLRVCINLHRDGAKRHPASEWWSENVARYERWLAAIEGRRP